VRLCLGIVFLTLVSLVQSSQVHLCFLAAEIAWHQMRKEWVGNRSTKLERPPKESIVRYMHTSDFICYKRGEECYINGIIMVFRIEVVSRTIKSFTLSIYQVICLKL